MLIRKINSVFMRHSRWLFGIFTVVIIISFMGFMVPGQFGMGGCSREDMSVGTAYGDDVTYAEMRREMQSISAFLLLQGQEAEIDPQQAFFSICLRKAAANRGIFASDAEVTAFIRECPAFRADGAFSYAKYEEVRTALHRRGIDDALISDAIRSAIVSQKVQRELGESAIATPGEAEVFYLQANEKISARVADFNRERFAAEVKLDAAAIKEFFTANRDGYFIPAQLTALVVKFPFNQPEVLKAAGTVGDAELKTYFEVNSAEFAGKDGVVPDFAKVKSEVKTKLVAAKVREQVNLQAQAFAREAYDAVGEAKDKAAAFQQLAKTRKLQVIQTAEFGVDADRIGDIAEPALIRQLGEVFDSVPVTNAVVGRGAAYVGLVTGRKAQRAAEFNEVNRRVQEDFIRKNSIELARAAAAKALEELRALPADKLFADQRWTRTLDFSLMTLPPSQVDQLAAAQAMGLKAGSVSDVLPTPDGAVLIGVVKRETPAAGSFEKEKVLWEMQWRNMKYYSITAAFQNEIEANCKFTLDRAK